MRDEYELLFQACEIIARHQKIKLVRPSLPAGSDDLFDYIDKIAETADIRVRKVALNPQWHKKDCGALLIFHENYPCVLRPKKTGGYELIDLKHKRKLAVTGSLAAQLCGQCFYFYPALNEKIHNLNNLLSFSLSKVRFDFAMFLFLQMLISFFLLTLPMAFGYLFNQIIANNDLPLLAQLSILLALNACVIILFYICQRLFVLHLQFKLAAITAPALIDKILKSPLRLFRRFSTVDLLFRMHIAGDVQISLVQAILSLCSQTIAVIFLLVWLFFYSPGFAAISLLMVLLISLVFLYINYQQLIFMRRLYTYFSQTMSLVSEFMSGIVKIRVNNAMTRVFQLWYTGFLKRSRAEFKIKIHKLSLDILAAFLILINPVVLYGLSSWLGEYLSFGDFAAFNIAYTLLFLFVIKSSAPISDIIRVIPLWKKAQIIFAGKLEKEKGSLNPGELTGEISLKNISFRYYEDDQPLFKDFSFFIHPGECVAIVGPSGSGKSTLFRLILGFEDPEAGEIYFNGLSLRTLKKSTVRRQIGVVIQNSALIPGTIFTNIAGSSTQMTRKEAWEIAEKVGMTELIKNLPMQMDTLISEGTINLSGGEIQRLILARALAQKPKILILDEATSALDNTTQAVIHHYLKELQATQIIAAHRLSTIVNADRIVVIESGAIVQMGTFSELISTPGLFAKMAKRQL